MAVYWADVSQFQSKPIDDSYPHRVFSFRTNSGNTRDTLALENARRAKVMLDAGKLDLVIPYYFFWPHQANCDLHKDILTEAGLWGHPKTVTMVDVEGAPLNGAKRVRGDQSAEINDEINRLRGWYGNPKRVIGYWNPKADPELWLKRPDGLPLVVPHYNGTPGASYDFAGRFAHQYSDRVPCAPFGACDANFTALDPPALFELLGINTSGGTIVATPEDVQEQLRGPKLEGWPQLGDFLEPKRTVVNALGRLIQIGNFQVDQLDGLTGKKPSIVDPSKSFDAGEYLRLIDAAAFRIEAAVKRVEDLLTPKDGK